MPTLAYTHAHNLLKLQEELEAAVPSLVRTVQGQREALYTLASSGDALVLTVPDGTDEAAVADCIAAHNANTQTEQQQAAAADALVWSEVRDKRDEMLDELADAAWNPLTAAQRGELLRKHMRRVIRAIALLARDR